MVPRSFRLGPAIIGAALISLAAGAQTVSVPVPIPAPRSAIAHVPAAFPIPAPRTSTVDTVPASETDDPLGALLERVTGPTEPVAESRPVVIGLRLVEEAGRSRFVVELSDPVDVHVFTLTDPNRVVIDMPEVLWRAADTVRPTGRGPVESYRYGLFREGNSRFVIDLNTPCASPIRNSCHRQTALGFAL